MKDKQRKKKNRKKRIAVTLACIIFFVSSVLIGLQIGVIYTDHTWKHWYPDYEKEDISAVLERKLSTRRITPFYTRRRGLLK